MSIDPRLDLHTHSTFSDGKDSLADNVRAAERCGLHTLGAADHVRRDTPWLPAYVAELRHLRRTTDIRLVIGVEAKILDEAGRLDLPEDHRGVERVLIADHQLPLGLRCYRPKEIRQALASGDLTAARCIDALINGTLGALKRHPSAQIAHLFSILPKLGLSQDQVSPEQLQRLARGLRRGRALVEISERWRCPGPRVMEALRAGGVSLCLSTDAHRKEHIGNYRWALDAAERCSWRWRDGHIPHDQLHRPAIAGRLAAS